MVQTSCTYGHSYWMGLSCLTYGTLLPFYFPNPTLYAKLLEALGQSVTITGGRGYRGSCSPFCPPSPSPFSPSPLLLSPSLPPLLFPFCPHLSPLLPSPSPFSISLPSFSLPLHPGSLLGQQAAHKWALSEWTSAWIWNLQPHESKTGACFITRPPLRHVYIVRPDFHIKISQYPDNVSIPKDCWKINQFQ